MHFIKHLIISLFFSLILSSCGHIEDMIIPFTAKPIGQSDKLNAFDRKTDGDFTAILMIIKNEDEVMEQEKLGKKAIKFRQIDEIKKGSSGTVMIDLAGCKPNKNNACEVHGDIVVLDPNGKTYFQQSMIPIMVNDGAIPLKMFRLSAAHLRISAEKKDVVGKYIIKLKIKDEVANRSVDLITNFSIIE